MLAENPKLKSLIEQLKGQFQPIFDATPPAERGGFSTAEDCLYADIMSLGLCILSKDNLAPRLEGNLLAELLSFIKRSTQTGVPLPYESLLQTLDAQIAAAPVQSNRGWPTLTSIAMARKWKNSNPILAKSAQALVATFSSIVNDFVICDGRVTGDEIKLLTSFDMTFAF